MIELIIVAVAILIGTLFPGTPGSQRWEIATTVLCWAAVVALPLWLILGLIGEFTDLATLTFYQRIYFLRYGSFP